MLSTILQNAIPLSNEAILNDEWGWGIRIRVFRKDANWYAQAIQRHPAWEAFRSGMREDARLQQAGGRRRKGGRVHADEMEPAPVITRENMADMLAGDVFEVVSISDEASEFFGVKSTDPAEMALELLQSTPEKDGRPLTLPAAYRVVGEEATPKPVWQVADVRESDDEVPYGGFGPDQANPTLPNIISLWVTTVASDPETFEGDLDAVEDGIATVRPTLDGNGSSSDREGSSSAEP